jgi:hypothetical protein
MPRNIVNHLAAAGGVADVHGIFQVEMRGHRRQIVGIVIHVVPVAHLGRAAVAATIMGYDAIAMLNKE